MNVYLTNGYNKKTETTLSNVGLLEKIYAFANVLLTPLTQRYNKNLYLSFLKMVPYTF